MDDTTDTDTFIFPPDPPDTDIFSESRDFDSRDTNGYMYSNIKLFDKLNWTLGVSYDSFDSRIEDEDRFNPKIGLIWDLVPSTTLRAAAFWTIKRPFASNQTIEPTQVSGFNQFFDDLDGSKTRRYGVALDQEFSQNLFGGMEFTWRDVEIPVFQQIDTTTMSAEERQDEQFHRAYLYWTPTNRLAFSAEYHFEKFDRRLTELSNPEDPTRITTHRVPFGVSYFNASGIFTRMGATFVNQEVDSLAGGRSDGNDKFWIVDASIGYRLPKRWGIASVGVKNLFDEDFHFQDINFQSGEPLTPLFQPDRMVFAQVTISF
jgi:outer membrane receptor protein involved in Fe transport